MDLIDVLKKLEGKIIKTANITCFEGVSESLDIVFTDGTTICIYGEMKEINEINIAMHE